MRLLDAAADRARERGERILIVVDGLDEDTGPSSGSGLPSIASLLPRRLPDEVRVLVTSRPHPELPLDLPDRHPLRSVTPLRLADSSHAHGIELAAKRELARLFAGGGVQVELLGLLTAASGGLTASNLEELTGSPPFIIEELVSGALGRAVARRSYAASDAVSDVVYLFGHETLREVAEQQLGSTVIRYRDRLHAWAESYRQRGWPTDTPIYLLREYTRILMPTTAVPSGDLPRLMAYATDPGRHDRLLDFTGGDFFALTEVRNAQSLNLRQPEPDVGAALSLAMSRDRLVQRSGLIPTGLPAVWAKLGQPARAEGLARGIHDPFRQVEALCSLVLATWRAADHDRAEQLLRAAVEVAETIGDDPIRREAALLRLVDVACTIAQTGVAHALTGMITDAERVAPALARVVGAVAEGGAVDRALTLLDEIGSPGWQAAAMVGICAAASRPDDDRSRSLVDRARELIVDLPDPAHRALLLTRLAVLSTGMRDGAFPRLLLDEAAASAEEIDNSAQRTEALARIAVSDIDAGPEPARAVLARLKATARTLDAAADAPASDLDTGPESADVGKLVDAAALLGDDDLALSFSRRLSEPRACARALVRAAAVAARTGLQRQASSLLAQAEQAAAWIEDTYESAVALGALVDAAVLLGELGRAEALANAVPHPFRQAEALLRVASAAVERGDLETARTLVGRSEALGREESGALPRASAARLVEAALAAGDLDAAELLARRIPHSYEQAAALLGVIDAAVAAGEVERAAAIAVVVGDACREEALIRAVDAHLSVDDVDRALGLARTISRPHGQAAALEQVIDHALDHGDVEGARELAHEILDPGRRAVVLGRVAADALVRSADFVDMQFLAGGAFRDFLESAQVATVERLIKLAVVDDDFRRAERFVDGSPEHSRKDLQTQLVDALLAAAQFDRAQELINRIDGLAARSRALAAYAEATATADPDRSRSALVEADELARRDGTWTVRARVASAAAAVGALDTAEALLDDIRDRPGSVEPHSVHRSRYGFGDLIDARVRRGDLESAIKLVNETSGQGRLPPIRRLVESMVAAGYGDRAEDVPTSVTGTQTQAAVWAALARATLDAAGPSSSAVASDARRKSRAYVAKALELDRWVGHLVLACRLDRSTLDVALQYHGIILDGRGL